MKRTRLAAAPQTARSIADRKASVIRDVAVCTTGPALGHGFDVDATTIDQLAAALDGIPGRWTHGSMSEDGLARHLGRWSNPRVDATAICRACRTEGLATATCPDCQGPAEPVKRVIGDFTFSPSAFSIKPDGLDVSAPEYLLARCEEDPTTLGVSVVAFFAKQELLDAEGKPNGKFVARLAPAEGEVEKPLQRADFVGDPAANPTGLSALHAGTGAVSELTEGALEQLHGIVERLGPAEAKRRALAFVEAAISQLAPTKPNPELEAALSARDAEIAKLKSQLEERAKKDATDFVSKLRADAAKRGSPIPEPRLALVAAAFARGDEATARTLGEVLADLSTALSRGADKNTKSVHLGTASEAERLTEYGREIARSDKKKKELAS